MICYYKRKKMHTYKKVTNEQLLADNNTFERLLNRKRFDHNRSISDIV